MYLHFFNSAVIANSKLDYNISAIIIIIIIIYNNKCYFLFFFFSFTLK